MNEKFKVGIDLFMDLKLYKIPQSEYERLQKKFTNVEFIPVNVKGNEDTPEDIDIYWGNRITKEIIKKSKNLKWIHFGSVGVDKARTDEVTQRNITISNSKGLLAKPMAVTAVAMMTSLSRGIHHTIKMQENKTLNRAEYDQYFYELQELYNQKVLIVGLGDVGKKIARVCKAFDMNVVGIKENIDQRIDNVDNICRLSELESVIGEADYVINILPLTNSTERVFNKTVLGNMKRSAFFINIGRGETVDESSLIEVLLSKKIAGAALDVFEKEPLSMNSKLLEIDNVILMPHVAGVSEAYWKRQIEVFEYNLEMFLKKDCESMINLVDLKKYL